MDGWMDGWMDMYCTWTELDIDWISTGMDMGWTWTGLNWTWMDRWMDGIHLIIRMIELINLINSIRYIICSFVSKMWFMVYETPSIVVYECYCDWDSSRHGLDSTQTRLDMDSNRHALD
jgi:hypothetical protein